MGSFFLPRKQVCLLFVLGLLIVGCQGIDDGTKPVIAPPLTNGGADFFDVTDFSVTLSADDLRANETGKWAIHSGLVDNKVFFSSETNPKAVFHGLPGEEYSLLWHVRNGSNVTSDTVKVHFSPLQPEIVDDSHSYYQTRRRLYAKSYDRGKWTIEGNYQQIRGQSLGGISVPDDEAEYITFYGYENTDYKFTWTTWYGSKSASVTFIFRSGEYHQDEALEDLGKLNKPLLVKRNDAGDVTELNMYSDPYGWMFGDSTQFPALKALKHLTKLQLNGSSLSNVPHVISAYYHKLQVLDLSHTRMTQLGDDFGNLTELDTLYMNSLDIPSLPESFGNLKSLRYLEMTKMGLTSLPESFSNLSSLNFLNCELNYIDKLPETFGNLRSLETFRGPVLAKSIPASFSALSKLSFCFFTVTERPAVLPDDFGRLSELDTLWLSGDYRALPESFSSLVSLRNLSVLYGSGLSSIPESFRNLTELRMLRLVVKVSELPFLISGMVNLKNFALHGFLDFLPDEIGTLTNLETLGASHVALKAIPESIGQLKILTTLNLSGNEITDVPVTIADMASLKNLYLGRNKITKFPRTMGRLSDTLRDLQINGNPYLEGELIFLQDALPNTSILTWLAGDN